MNDNLDHHLLVLGIALALVGCRPRHRAPGPAAAAAVPSVLSAVGAHPRGYARLDLRQPRWQQEMSRDLDAVRRARNTSLATCGFDPTHMREVRVAVGEPLRVVAEVDGAVSLRVLTCLIGADNLAELTRFGIQVNDRPGGLSIEYRPDREHATEARAGGGTLERRCVAPSCAAIALGPPDDRLWVTARIDDKIQLRIEGARLDPTTAVTVRRAVAQAAATSPALHDLAISEDHGALVAEVTAPDAALAAALRSQLLEAFKIPAVSMFPTLRSGDHVFAVKGPLFGAPAPGDVLVFRHDGTLLAKRYIAGPGHTVSETGGVIAIDSHPLPSEVIERAARYDYEEDGTTVTQTGTVVREHLGARSYTIFHSAGSAPDGSWTVPPGEAFLIGDARENSNDSRYFGPVSQADIVGRVAFIWFASEKDAPDWNRIGMLVK